MNQSNYINSYHHEKGLGQAVLKTLAYADMFDYPLTLRELHRYLHEAKASWEELETFMDHSQYLDDVITNQGIYFFLKGREKIVRLRKHRETKAQERLLRAYEYGRTIGRLPFVRMVALTGSLAVANADGNDDFDYFMITVPGRLWLCRSISILYVHWIHQHYGDIICPNYLITSMHLETLTKDIYIAHEIAQMVPIIGMEMYLKYRDANRWVLNYLPNSVGGPPQGTQIPWTDSSRISIMEHILSNNFFNSLERWVMAKKIKALKTKQPGKGETHYSAHSCQGHVNGHAQKTLHEYKSKLQKLSGEKSGF